MDDTLTAFLDTNILLHYPPLDEIDWLKIFKVKAVELVLCLPVIDELDKYKNDPRFGERANRAIATTSLNVEQIVRDGVKVAVYVNLKECGSGDHAILQQLLDYKSKNPHKRVEVITEDRGMELRSQALGVQSLRLPTSIRLSEPWDEDRRQLNALKRENEAMKSQRPRISLLMFDPMTEAQTPPTFNLVRPPEPQNFQTRLEERLQKLPHWTRAQVESRGDFATVVEAFGAHYATARKINDESARTIGLRLKVTNEGNAPATRVQLSIKFPAIVQAVVYRDGIRIGQRTNPEYPRNYQHLHLDDLVLPIQSVPPTIFNGMPLHYYNENFADAAYHIEIPELAHRDSRETETFYLTFSDWEQVRPFDLNATIRIMSPPDYFNKNLTCIARAEA